MARFLLPFAVVLLLPILASACTSMMFGSEATEDGSIFVGQSDDGEGASDSRLVKVPAKDWPAGSMRPIVDYGDYPRYVGTERGIPFYFPSKTFPNATVNIIGAIPQVNHTYGFLEANYAISNEMGVAFGESTCSSRTFAKSRGAGGPSLLSMYELSRLAAERAASSRAAVLIMGEMAEQYGFYGDAKAATGGESLLIADSEEQWIFHILAESEEKGGAIWAAQRIPKGHITVVSNAFVLGEINDKDGDNFLYSRNMHAVAKANGWWDGKGLLHFTQAFSLGEYSNKYYAGRRMWALYHTLASEANVPSTYESYVEAIGDTYPVSAAPDRPVKRSDVFSMYRNYYQGTAYDLSSGLAAGPFGTPVRFKPGSAEAIVNDCKDQCGRWERSIHSFRTTCIYQTNIRPSQPLPRRSVTWFLPGAALSGVFSPVLPTADEVPAMLGEGLNDHVDRSTAFWAFREVAQFMYPRWSRVQHTINTTALAIEAAAQTVIDSLDLEGSEHSLLVAACNTHNTEAVTQWQQLYNDLIVKFSDGWDYQFDEVDKNKGASTALGYPAWWLKLVGYTDGPTPCHPTCR